MQKVAVIHSCQVVDIQVNFKILIVAAKVDTQNWDFGIDQNAVLHLKNVLLFEK